MEEIVCTVAQILGVEIKKDEIDAAHRVQSRNDRAHRPIVAQIGSRKKRDAILRNRRQPVYNNQVTKQQECWQSIGL